MGLGFWQSAVAFVVLVGILITVHEWGHFWVARRVGIKVLRFSIGFGKPLLAWHDKLGTEYVLGLLPLGGYVKMLDEREETVSPCEKHQAFNQKSLKARMAVVLAGPLCNLLFAVLLYWGIFFIGIQVLSPVLGAVPQGSEAHRAGLSQDQEILQIEGHNTPSWDVVMFRILQHMDDEEPIKVRVKDRKTNAISDHFLSINPHVFSRSSEGLGSLGLVPWDPVPAIVGAFVPEAPAEHSGLRIGDRIVKVNNVPIHTRLDLMQIVQKAPLEPLELTVLREGTQRSLFIMPEAKTDPAGKTVGFLGIQFDTLSWPSDLIHTQRYGFFPALGQAILKTLDYSWLTLRVLKKMVMGELTTEYLSGPITLAQYAGVSMGLGWIEFISLMAIVSISIGILNLLPIPLLDGGHFLYCLYEGITGRAPSEKIIEYASKVGLICLLLLMTVAFYNDIARLIG